MWVPRLRPGPFPPPRPLPLAFIKHPLCARRGQLGTASLRWNPMHHRKAGATLFRNRALGSEGWSGIRVGGGAWGGDVSPAAF